MEEIRPLSRQQQIFLQRFFALHVLTDMQAQSLFDDVLAMNHHEQQGNQLGRDVKDTFKRINRSLIPAFRLEIKSVSLALSLPVDSDNDDLDEGDDGIRQKRPVIYHTIVNCDSDEVSKSAANPTFTKSPHEFALFRLLLEKLIERDDAHPAATEDATSSSSSSSSGKGCQSCMSRLEMINTRLDLTGPHEGKLTIGQAENVLDLLEVQGWFVPAAPPANGNRNGGEGSETISSPSSSVRKRRRNGSSGNSSSAVGGGSKYLQIGPRSYLEFPDFLIKVGLDDAKLPQFLVHG